MSKKTLNVNAITNELEGASLFFSQGNKSPAPPSNPAPQAQVTPIADKSEPVVSQPTVQNPIQPSQDPKPSTEITDTQMNDRSNEQSNARTNIQTNNLTDKQTNERTTEQNNDRTNKRTFERTNQLTNEQTHDRSNGKLAEERVVKQQKRIPLRSSFDIYADQLLALKEIALNREKITADKVLLGDLAKEALDLLIAKEKLK